MTAEKSTDSAEKNPETVDEATQSAASIVRFVEDHYELGCTTDGLLYAAPRDPGLAKRATELQAIRSTVTRDLYRLEGRVPGKTAMSAAFDTLAGIAAESPVSKVYLRAARVGSAIHIDLGGRAGDFVEVSPYGWEIRRPGAERILTRREHYSG